MHGLHGVTMLKKALTRVVVVKLKEPKDFKWMPYRSTSVAGHLELCWVFVDEIV